MSYAMVANNLPVVGAVGSLDAYVGMVNRIPVLTAEDEQQLARRLHDEQDLDAARNLIMAHLRFVVHVARGYQGYGLGLADLIQEGNIGLMKAVKRFDPAVGVRLVSFAVHWIRAEIHEFILKNWRIVKVATTKAQRKLFFNLRRAKKRLGWLSAAEVQMVADDLGVDPKSVKRYRVTSWKSIMKRLKTTLPAHRSSMRRLPIFWPIRAKRALKTMFFSTRRTG